MAALSTQQMNAVSAGIGACVALHTQGVATTTASQPSASRARSTGYCRAFSALDQKSKQGSLASGFHGAGLSGLSVACIPKGAAVNKASGKTASPIVCQSYSAADVAAATKYLDAAATFASNYYTSITLNLGACFANTDRTIPRTLADRNFFVDFSTLDAERSPPLIIEDALRIQGVRIYRRTRRDVSLAGVRGEVYAKRPAAVVEENKVWWLTHCQALRDGDKHNKTFVIDGIQEEYSGLTVLFNEYRDELLYFTKDSLYATGEGVPVDAVPIADGLAGYWSGREKGNVYESSWWAMLANPRVRMTWPRVTFDGETVSFDWVCIDRNTNEMTAYGDVVWMRLGDVGACYKKYEHLYFLRDVYKAFFDSYFNEQANAAPKLPLDQLKKRYLACEAALKERLESAHSMPICLRLAWHDAGTYRSPAPGVPAKPWPDCGGANGSIHFPEELSQAANAGLPRAIEMLSGLKADFPEVTWADFIQMAGAVAVELTGGPKIPMKYGRMDSDHAHIRDDELPDAAPPFPDKAATPAQHIRNKFYRMGLNDEDMVALSGAHTLGRGGWPTPSPLCARWRHDT
eukprot:jgi/Mesvir1/9724/Mv12193-RA.2